MSDKFQGHQRGLSSPPEEAAAVTPNDTTPLAQASRAIYVGGAGNLSVTMLGGQNVTFAVQAGTLLPLRASHVRAAGTTATGIVALW